MRHTRLTRQSSHCVGRLSSRIECCHCHRLSPAWRMGLGKRSQYIAYLYTTVHRKVFTAHMENMQIKWHHVVNARGWWNTSWLFSLLSSSASRLSSSPFQSDILNLPIPIHKPWCRYRQEAIEQQSNGGDRWWMSHIYVCVDSHTPVRACRCKIEFSIYSEIKCLLEFHHFQSSHSGL